MKIAVLVCFTWILFSNVLHAQKMKKMDVLQKIQTREDAINFRDNFNADYLKFTHFNSKVDSLDFGIIRSSYKVNDIFFDKKGTYKILAFKQLKIYKCAYYELTKAEVDSYRLDTLVPYYSIKNHQKLGLDSISKRIEVGWHSSDVLGEDFTNALEMNSEKGAFIYPIVGSQLYRIVVKNNDPLIVDAIECVYYENQAKKTKKREFQEKKSYHVDI